ncbi:MAG: cytochrome D1 domain-containing protein [Steroidobacteraceae bacterium]
MRLRVRIAPAACAAFCLFLLPLCARAGRAYVSNEDGHSVSVIDTAREAVIATVEVGKRPRGMQLSPNGSRLYVAVSGRPKCPPTMPDEQCAKLAHDFSADGIAVVDTRSLKLLHLLPAGSDPERFDISRNGRRLYVANEDAGTASVVDVPSATVLKRVPVGREPEGVRVSPRGAWVAVTNETDSTVSLIDTKTLQVEHTVKVGFRPRDIVFTPDGRTAYVPGEADGTVYRFAVPDGMPMKVVQLRLGKDLPASLVLDAARRRLYAVTGRGGMLAVISLEGPRLVAEIPVGKRPWGLALTPDHRYIYTANGPSNDVTVVDTRTLKVVKKIPVGRSPWGVVIGK